MNISMIIAIADNGVIGKDEQMPWNISGDLRHFKQTTMGKPIVMGRKTWESLPKRPLVGRPNIVVTANRDYAADGAEVLHTIHQAVARAKVLAEGCDGEVVLIGGAQIYKSALPMVRRIYLTEVHARPLGDAHFWFDRAEWKEVSRENRVADFSDSADYSIVVLERRGL